MRLSTIEFNGYKRLSEAICNVDGQTIAFIGPNESGKSSVLQGLEWLTDDEQDELLVKEQNRRHPPSSDALVVRARFRIDDNHIASLQALNLDVIPPVNRSTVTEFRISRKKDGSVVTGVSSVVGRNPKPFRNAVAALEAALEAAEKSREGAHQLLTANDIKEAEDLIDLARTEIAPENATWGASRVERIRDANDGLHALVSAIESVENPPSKLARFREKLEKAISALQTAADAGARPDPELIIRTALHQHAPKFLLFTDDDRDLAEIYVLQDQILRASPPAPLRNLLTVAGTTVQEVWSAISIGETSAIRTLEHRLNETLRSRLQPMWTQSRPTILISLNQGGVLEVNILELDSPDYTVTPIAERSDGLRAFLGLVCFLIAADLSTPPILMIDEAERNLHYDAQSDLVRVLTKELKVHKVIYTTHSPGCLPLDLGTGIRVVARNPDDTAVSTLENNFWTKNEPGFSHLLFAMGAEAAAFSAFRRALLAEGVSEMILLPTLLRNATDGTHPDFQVAFGLSNLSAPRTLGSVALITTFLVDGDGSGDTKKKQLLKAGVPKEHVFQLPKGKAIEDLVERATYLRVVNDFLGETGKNIPGGVLS